MSAASPVTTITPAAAGSAVSAFVETNLTGNNNDLRFTWNLPGTVGNGKTVAGTFSGSYTTVAVATTGSPTVSGIVITGPTSATAAQVIAAVKNTPAVATLVAVRTKLGNDGSGTMATFSALTLASGTGTAPHAPVTTV